MMPQYSLRRFLATIILLSSGVASCVIGCKASDASLNPLPLTAAAGWLIGGPMIGAGILAPFNREWLGAIIGFVIASVFTAYVAFISIGFRY
jgi:hypothetical protein